MPDPNTIHPDWNTYRKAAKQGASSSPLDWLTLWPSWATRAFRRCLNHNPFIELLRAMEPLGVLVAVIGIWFAVIQTQSAHEELEHTREQTRLARESFEADRLVREMTLDALAWEALERSRSSRGDVGQYEALVALRETKKGDFTHVNFSRMDVTTHPHYQRHARRERSEWPPAGCNPGSPWTADSLRFGNRLRRTCGCGSIRRLSA